MQALDNQRLIIGNLDQNIFISAGAGTGKTHILVQRFIEILEQGKAEVSQIVAITFTEKAAKEMKDRIRATCIEKAKTVPRWESYKRDLENSRIDTIHGLCARLIKENPFPLGIDPLSRILDETEGLALMDKFIHNKILSLLEEKDSEVISIISEYGFKETKEIIKTLVKNRIDIDRISKGSTDRAIFNIYEKIKLGYEDFKKRQGLLDFDDLIIYAKRLLRENKSIRRRYQKMIRYILVDEFQDTDFHQREIIFYLAEDGAISMTDNPEDIVLSKDKLFIVGDSKQSIYRFRGADVSVFNDTYRLMEKIGRCFELNINYRSLPQNIRFINDLFGKIMGRNSEGKKDYETIYTDILPSREDKTNKQTVEFLVVEKDLDETMEVVRHREADLIARRILTLDVPFKDVAVLFRAMTNVKIYEEAFRRYRIPYYVIAGSGFFARQEIKDILNFLKVLEDENNKIALAGVLRSPMFGLSDNELYKWAKDKREPEVIVYLRKLKDRLTLSGLIQEIVRCTNYKAILATQYMGEQSISNINKMIEAARRFEEKGLFTLKDFVNYIDELVTNEAREGEAPISEEESNVVKIMTIHKAKGLEFPVVIIPDVQREPKPVRGIVLFDKGFDGLGLKVKGSDGEYQDTPTRKLIKQQIERKELAESKRLLYVASTRAKDYLIYSGVFSGKQNTWGNWLWEFADKVKIITQIPLPPSTHQISQPHREVVDLPLQTILRQIEPITVGPRAKITPTGSNRYIWELGIRVHEFFKRWNFIDIPEDEEIKKFVMNFIKHPIFEEIKNAIEIKRELPITYAESGIIVEGVIDLLYKKRDGGWVLLDYKTDNITQEELPAHIERYKEQIQLYSAGINKVLGIIPQKTVIFFLTPGIAYTLP